MKVELEMKNGKNRMFNAQVAKVLIAKGLGREVPGGGYMTRDMRADPVAVPETAADPESDSLRAELDKRGIKYHHRAGVAKLRELLEG